MSFITYLLLICWTGVCAHFLLARSRWFQTRLAEQASARFPGLDGLRGLLATGVFFSHLQVFAYFRLTGSWVAPTDPLFRYLGNGCVMIFFLITGFLFWTKAIESGGNVRMVPLYVNRIRRIAPLYLVHALIILVSVGVMTTWTIQEDLGILTEQLAQLLGLGFVITSELNGKITVMIGAGVTWSLSYEWWFYIALPFLALLARSHRALAIGILVYILVGPSLDLYSLHYDRAGAFWFGIVVAEVVHRYPKLPEMATGWIAAPILLAVNTSIHGFKDQVKLPALLVSSVVLAAVIYGNTFFGVLRIRTLRLLGLVSYSTYLMHGFVVAGLWQGLRLALGTTRGLPAVWDFLVAFIACPLVVLVSMASYRWIEYPFIKKRARPVGAS